MKRDDLADIAKRHAERRVNAESPPSFLKAVAELGSLGWLVVLPALAGLMVGRWLDGGERLGWTGRLLAAGLATGFWLLWRKVRAP